MEDMFFDNRITTVLCVSCGKVGGSMTRYQAFWWLALFGEWLGRRKWYRLDRVNYWLWYRLAIGWPKSPDWDDYDD